MEKRLELQQAFRLAAVASIALLIGCGSPVQTAPVTSQSYPQLKVIGILAGRFMSENNGRPPRSREEFVDFLESIPQEWQGLGMRSVDEFLTSPRDGEPLVVVVGKKLGQASPSGLPWVAYEQTGVRGKFLAINARGGVTEMSEAELTKMFPQS